MYIAFAVAAGVGLAFQAVINSRLRTLVDSALWAALVQVFVGLVVLAAAILFARESAPSLAGASRAPWWIWTGGLLGALYVLAAIVATPPLGAAVMLASVVVGQTVAALVIDHYGWFGVTPHPLTAVRMAGAALLIGGVLLMRAR
jgi:transporter family-2 protein